MFCKNCGAQIDDDSKFCTVCGNTISQTAGVANNQSQQPVNSNHNTISYPNANTNTYTNTNASARTNAYANTNANANSGAQQRTPNQDDKFKRMPLWKKIVCIYGLVAVCLVFLLVIILVEDSLFKKIIIPGPLLILAIWLIVSFGKKDKK